MSRRPRPPQIQWIARGGWPKLARWGATGREVKLQPRSFRLLLLGQGAHRLLSFAQVFDGQLAGLNKVRHHRLRPAAEKRQQFVNQTALGRMAGNDGFKDMRIAYFFCAAKHLLLFHPVNGGLHSGISGAAPFREGLLNFADGGGAALPQYFHDLQFEFGEPWQRHNLCTMNIGDSTMLVVACQGQICRTWNSPAGKNVGIPLGLPRSSSGADPSPAKPQQVSASRDSG